MKKLMIIIILLSINACSSSSYSKYKTNNLDSIDVNTKKITNIEIMSMTMDEFEIYIDDYIINSPYPNLD